MNTGSSRMADQSFAMNGGKGIYSYAKNSSHQRNAADALKGKMEEAIAEKLDIKSLISNSKAFRIADFGCSTGPNTFIAMQNVVESIERKYRSEYPTSDQIPEFQVFFTDQTSNDFNTLFNTSPPDRPYFAAGVAGSFYTRLFPECSLHFAYSCAALHYLSKIPNELLDETTLSWNKGRIHYTNASSEVVKAYATQYAEGIRMFLDARAKEVVAGGMVVIIMPIDPFADWPPRPGSTSNGSGRSNNGAVGMQASNYTTNLTTGAPNAMNSQNNGNDSWAFNSHSSFELLKPNQGASTLNSSSFNSGLNAQNSMGFLKQNQGMPLGSYNDKKSKDIGSIFSSSKNEQTALKIAPPPLTAVGRGRGRGGTSTSRPSQAKPQSGQPPLLDLL